LGDIRIHKVEIDYTLGPNKALKSFEETHSGYDAETMLERVGLARTGGKQAILTHADHRFIELIEFVSHTDIPPFFRLS
jgi:hypothetical protein